MDELARIERDLETVERYEQPVSFAVAIAFAVLYLWWQYTYNHWIAMYTWMIPFAIGYAIPHFGFAVRGARLDRERRALLDPSSQRELPAARIVARAQPMPTAPAVRAEAPVVIAIADPREGPRVLK